MADVSWRLERPPNPARIKSLAAVGFIQQHQNTANLSCIWNLA